MLKTTNVNVAREVLKVCVDRGQKIHPRKFCRRWFGLEDICEDGQPRYTEVQILEMEAERGYREQCINLIARVLKVKPNTVHRWGKGVEFDRIPSDKQQQYESYLGYVDALRTIAMSLSITNEAALIKIFQQLQSSKVVSAGSPSASPFYRSNQESSRLESLTV